jgi:hypothetical protein
MNKEKEITGDNEFLDTFGFATKEARKNLVIFFLVLLVFSNVFWIYRNMQLESTIIQLNKEKIDLTLDLSSKITEEVRKQIQPTASKIEEVANRVDSVTTKTSFILSKKN